MIEYLKEKIKFVLSVLVLVIMLAGVGTLYVENARLEKNIQVISTSLDNEQQKNKSLEKDLEASIAVNAANIEIIKKLSKEIAATEELVAKLNIDLAKNKSTIEAAKKKIADLVKDQPSQPVPPAIKAAIIEIQEMKVGK